ncbi:hypothetical protein GCM10022206_12660 [Streptomyces chiangmaiensis]
MCGAGKGVVQIEYGERPAAVRHATTLGRASRRWSPRCAGRDVNLFRILVGSLGVAVFGGLFTQAVHARVPGSGAPHEQRRTRTSAP